MEDLLGGLEAQNRLEEPSVNFEKAVTKILETISGNPKILAKNKKSAEIEPGKSCA